MAELKSLVSRILLWLGVAAFCAALAVACSVAQPPDVQAQSPAGQAPSRPAAVPTPVPSTAIGTVAARGRDYARAACADCHQVEPDGPQPPYSGAPAFHKVAVTPGMTSIALLAWLHTSHTNMPNLVVPRDRLDDLLAWFDYLRTTGKNLPKPPQLAPD
jgi:mono/diheme cytochrome c family protein